MRSVMQHNFTQVPSAEIRRSTFDRSHGLKTTFDSSYLIPVLCDEVLPGDTFNCRMNAFVRVATPIKPIMDNLHLSSFFFFVPNRLIWTKWNEFCGEQLDPDNMFSTDYLVPQIAMPDYAGGGVAVGSLFDYFGIPTGALHANNEGLLVNALHSRAYNLIWNEHFRDQNLQDRVVVDKDDGPDNVADYVLLKRGKRKDYFTSALPWPQKGPDVLLPLGDNAPIVGIGKGNTNFVNPGVTVYETNNPVGQIYASSSAIDPRTADASFFVEEDNGPLAVPGTPGIYADLANATAATINSLREAFQVQRLYERDARGGSRYTEIIRSHFGVISPDARLQRPEILGLGTTPVNIHPIAQTNATGATGTPQGNLAAFGTASIQGHGFSKSFTEHGVILGMVCVWADLTYQQGLNRMWSRRTRFDYYWPALANLGEQAVLNKEIYAQGPGVDTIAPAGEDDDEKVFGYQERYAEYRYKPSQITGEFRSTFATSLDVWHLSQEFGSIPQLGPDFIEENVPMDRVTAVDTEPEFLADFYFNMICARPMPVYSVPGFIDHL